MILMKEALVLFSGGKDSFLSTLLTLESGYKVNLVIYDNSMGLQSKNSLLGAKRILKKYGEDKVNIMGVKKIDAIWRELIKEFYNYDTDYIISNYGKITISQYNCLTCRLAMYIMSIIICNKYDIRYVVDGARKCQLFSIEQPIFTSEFIKLFKEYGISLNYPLLYFFDDFDVKNQILVRGFVPKMREAQCLLGMPIYRVENEEVMKGLMNVFSSLLYPKAKKIIEKYKNVDFSGDYL